VLAAVVVVLAVTSTLVAGQTPKPAAPQTPKAQPAAKPYNPPKTPWGDPDIQGTWTGDDYIGVPMARPNGATSMYKTDAELKNQAQQIETRTERDLQEFAGANANVTTGPPSHWGEGARHPALQNSLVSDPPDGRVPAVKPNPERQGNGAFNANDPAGPEAFSYYIRCISRGPAGSILPVIYGNGTQIVQGKGYVVLLQEMVHEARVIPIGDASHAGTSMKSYMGDSRGHWEGNTLVVETTNLLAYKTGVGANGGGTTLSDAAKLTERFTRTAADSIKYELTVDDPKTYEKQFTVTFPIIAEPGYRNFEYACHEGNYAMFNSLSGARADEKKAAAAAGQK
jgi:hypothetical protein